MAERRESKAKKTYMISLANRIVYQSQTKNVSLIQKHEISNLIQQVEGLPSDIENYPIAIFTVLGSNLSHFRKTYVNWLLYYLNNHGMHLEATLEDCKELEDTQTFPGIYILPTKNVIRGANNVNMVALVLYVHQDNKIFFDDFATVACSNIFVFTESEKVELGNRNKSICIMADKQPGNISVLSNIQLSDTIKQDKQAAASAFFQHLDKCTIDTVKQSDGTEILYKDIYEHLKNVESKINSTSMNTAHHADEVVNSNRSLGPPKEKQSFTKPWDDSLLDSHSLPNKTEQNLSQSKKKKHVTTKECPESCLALQESLKVLLHNWISKYLKPASITNIFDCCLSYRPSDEHNVFVELYDLISVISLYNSQLATAFDNYICFDGGDDEKQFSILAKSVYRQSFQALQSRHYVHASLTEIIFHSATIALHAHYINENKEIKSFEKKLANKLLVTFGLVYKDNMLPNFTSGLQCVNVNEVHAKVKHCVLLVAEKTINFNDRFSYISQMFIEQLSNQLNDSFLLFTKMYHGNIEHKPNFQEFDACIEKYLKAFYNDSLPPLNVLTSEQIIEQHEKAVQHVTSDIAWEQRETLLLRLYSHLAYVTEIAEQQQDFINLADKMKASSNAFCLYLTSEWYILQISTKDGLRGITPVKQKCQTPPPYAAITDQNKVIFGLNAENFIKNFPQNLKAHGKVLELLCNPNVDETASYLLVEFFKCVKTDMDEEFGGRNESAIVIIPPWLKVEQRLLLRNFAKCAGIKQIFLVNETDLLAYSLLCLNNPKAGNESTKSEFVVAAQILDNGIGVEIFKENSDKSFHQAAVSFADWSAVGPPLDGVRKVLHPVKGKAPLSNLFTLTNPISDCKSTLQNALQRTFSQIDSSNLNNIVHFCITSKHSEFNYLLKDICKDYENWNQVQNFQLHFSLPAATQFLKCPQKLAVSVLSHAVGTNYFNVIRQTYLKTYLSPKIADKVETKSEQAISDEKMRLLKKCKKMREQLSSGKVNVRKLMQKLIVQCIDRAEIAARDVHVTSDILKEEEQELDELISEHKFRM